MIKYLPNRLLSKIAPARKIEKMVTKNLTVNRAAFAFLNDMDFLSPSTVVRTTLKTVKEYKSRYQDLRDDEELTVTEAKDEALNDKKLLVNRVQNLVVKQVASEIKDQYAGEFFKWLPSDASEPDPEHQLKYGKIFQLGLDEMPGDRFGCRCGMHILVEDTKLDL